VTPRQALSQIAESPARGLAAGWWLSGPDAYFGEQVVGGIVRALGGSPERRRVDGRQDPVELALWLSTQSFLDDPRLLVWRDVDGRVAAGRAMSVLWKAISDRAVLVCWNDKPSAAPQGSPLVSVELAPLRGGAWAQFVRDAARTRSVALTPSALTLVTDATLASGHQLDAVLDRLALVHPKGAVLRDEDVAPHLPPGSSTGLFPLVGALMARNLPRAVREVSYQLEQGTAGLVLVITMARQVIWLERYLVARAEGQSEADFRRRADLRPWQWEQVQLGSRHWHADEATAWLERAGKADYALKHSLGDERTWVTTLVLSAAP